MEHIVPFITDKLFLKVNQNKTTVSEIKGIKYLGYGFYSRKGEYRLTVHQKSVAKMKVKLKELTRSSRGIGNEARKTAIRQYLRGWINYFVKANMITLMRKTDGWYRRRIRAIYWTQWKRVRTRHRKLRVLGMPEDFVHSMANCRKGRWRATKMLNRAMTKDWIHKEQGWISMADYYSEKHKIR